ncbi:MAG: AAA family ATPase [Anaerolineaceae bacterium]|nr:AAA family ATPase [Anaerolineaceae bacterium]
MINGLSLENFKAFANKQDIPMAPITLIYGENSSGKSSILYSLLLQKQTIQESSNPNTALLYKGSYTDQQNYSRCVNGRDVDKEIEISVKFRPISLTEEDMMLYPVYAFIPSYPVDALLSETEEEFLNELEKSGVNLEEKNRYYDYIDSNFTVFCTRYKNGNEGTKIYSLTIKNNEDVVAKIEKLKNKIESISEEGYEFPYSIQYGLDFDTNSPVNHDIYDYYISRKEAISESFIRTIYFSNKYKSHARDKEFIDYESFMNNFLPNIHDSLCLLRNGVPVYSESKSPYYKSVIHFLSKNYEKIIREISYLGPLRDNPKRFSDTAKDIYFDVGTRGENTTSILSRSPEVIDGVNRWLQRLGMNYELTIRELKEDEMLAFGDIHTLQVHDLTNRTPLTLCDVGFGISQVLPILTQGLIAKENSSVLIEQPEIHLHPKMQAELGDYFVERSKECQFIIETHSEHLLLRLMRRIRETTNGTIEDPKLQLRPREVSVLYVENKNGAATIRQMKISEDGDSFGEWPEGFFEERAKELF